ncbi:MAG: response regulator [Gammaproteobacteria bacterium]|nr:response regulator [Gammaproteobacteria bacterium]
MCAVKILHLEDNPDDASLIEMTLKRTQLSYDILWVDSKEKFEEAILKQTFDIILSDYAIPNYDGLTALHYIKKQGLETPYILLSGKIGEEKTIEIFQAGATDFISKDNLHRLAPAITRTFNEITEKKKRELAEKKLKQSEILFRQFTENIPQVFWQATPTLDKIIYVSPAYEKIWGKKITDLYENPYAWIDSIVEDEQAKVKEIFNEMVNQNKLNIEVEFKIVHPDGQLRVILNRVTLLKDNQTTIGIIGIATDITDSVQNRKKLEASLAEKEVMLKEIHHRVKNNLQVVSSLLNLQAKSIEDTSSKKIFLESSNRIKSMALIHEMLYRSDNLAQIEMQKYLKILGSYLLKIYRIDTSLVKLIIKSDSIALSIEEAIPCGLIINELISNAFKHAFPKGCHGEVNVLMEKQDNHVLLQVSDNGVGYSKTHDFHNSNTLGVQLIHALTIQLGGEIKLNNMQGTTFTLTYPSVSVEESLCAK